MRHHLGMVPVARRQAAVLSQAVVVIGGEERLFCSAISRLVMCKEENIYENGIFFSSVMMK